MRAYRGEGGRYSGEGRFGGFGAGECCPNREGLAGSVSGRPQARRRREAVQVLFVALSAPAVLDRRRYPVETPFHSLAKPAWKNKDLFFFSFFACKGEWIPAV